MKKNTHPEYFNDAKIICSCGAVLITGATQKEMHVEICSACHPFYTGKKKVLDSTGRVDRFKKLAEKSAATKSAKSKSALNEKKVSVVAKKSTPASKKSTKKASKKK